MSTPSTCADLSTWLDEQTEIAKREEAARHLRVKMSRATGIPTWEHQKHAFKVSLYRKAIGAAA